MKLEEAIAELQPLLDDLKKFQPHLRMTSAVQTAIDALSGLRGPSKEMRMTEANPGYSKAAPKKPCRICDAPTLHEEECTRCWALRTTDEELSVAKSKLYCIRGVAHHYKDSCDCGPSKVRTCFYCDLMNVLGPDEDWPGF